MATTAPPAPPRQDLWPVEFYRSAVGKKIVMAVTGVMLFGFVLFHMLGNLKMYLGAAHMDEYSVWLRHLAVPFVPESAFLWIMRTGLLVAVILHIDAAVKLTMINRRARPEAYTSKRDFMAANYASRTMRWSGVIVLAFIVYHLMHFTFGSVHPDFERDHVYHNVVTGLKVPVVAFFYIVANLLLGLHLFHGLWSLFQTLGFSHDRFDKWRRNFAVVFAVLITTGNVSFPIAVLTGVVK